MCDLFEASGVTVPASPPSPVLMRQRARDLLEAVEKLSVYMDSDIPERAERIARRAERIGAHSVARAVRWYALPDTLDRHGYDASTIHLECVARRWCERWEVGDG